MARKKLNKGIRESIVNFMTSRIKSLADKTELTTEYLKVREAVTEWLTQKFDQKEMLILEKYQVARRDKCIRFHSEYRYNYKTFCYHEYDNVDAIIPLQPNHGHCTGHQDVKMFEMINKFIDLEVEHNEAIHVRVKNIEALVNNAKYFEEVLEIIPALAEIESTLYGCTTYLPSVLSKEMLESIRNDEAAKVKDSETKQ